MRRKAFLQINMMQPEIVLHLPTRRQAQADHCSPFCDIDQTIGSN